MKKLFALFCLLFVFTVVEAQSLSPPSDLETTFKNTNISFPGQESTILNVQSVQTTVGNYTFENISISETNVGYTYTKSYMRSQGEIYNNYSNIEIPKLYKDLYLREKLE